MIPQFIQDSFVLKSLRFFFIDNYLLLIQMGNCSDTSDTSHPNQSQQANTNGDNTTPNVQKAPTTNTTANTTTQNTQNVTATTTTKPAQTTTTVTKTQTSGSREIHQQQLAKHNQYRAKHHSDPLVLSDWLCKYAQQWADHLAKTKQFQHSNCQADGKGVGENIYWTSGTVKGGDASKSWYDQVKDYKYGSGEGTFSKTGHFSQLVWKGSKEVGFGYAGGNVVASYYPAGNMMGSWQKNVSKP